MSCQNPQKTVVVVLVLQVLQPRNTAGAVMVSIAPIAKAKVHVEDSMDGTLTSTPPSLSLPSPPHPTYVCCARSGVSLCSSRLFSRIERIEEVRVKSMWPVSEQVFGVVVK